MTIAELQQIPYSEYLKTEWWQKIRKWVLIFWGHKCAVCNSSQDVEVHHRTYERRGRELITDCLVLCKDCHKTVHVCLEDWEWIDDAKNNGDRS